MLPLALIDAHVHLWDPTILPMPWLAEVPTLNHQYGLAEFAHDTTGIDIAGMVFVETGVAPQYALLEAQHMVQVAQHAPLLLGIIAAAPLEYGQRTRSYLAALHDLGETIKGVRRNVQDEADPHFCLQDDFVAGVHLLAQHDWTCDLCIRHQQLPAVTELVRRCPDVRFVLDHLGKPPIRLQQLDPWRDHLATLAQLPNVWCKLSGLVTEADHQQWQPAHLLPYLTHALTVFGPERILYGGDWPVLRLAASYRQWHTLLADALSSYDEAARNAIWAGTAQHVYRLVSPGQHSTE